MYQRPPSASRRNERPGSGGGLGETGRKLSLASAAMEQHKLNDAFRRENQKAIDFLTVQNAEYLKMLEPDEDAAGDSASAINTQAMRDTLKTFLERSALRHHQKPPTQSIKKRLAMTGTTTLSGSRQPVTNRKYILSQLSNTLPATTGVNLAQGRIDNSLLRRKAQAAKFTKPVKQPPKVAIGRKPVDYNQLLHEQRTQLDATAECDRDYRDMLNRYHTIQADVGRRFSLLLAESGFTPSRPGSASSRPPSGKSKRPNTTPPGVLANPSFSSSTSRPSSASSTNRSRPPSAGLPSLYAGAPHKPLSTLVGEVFDGLGARNRKDNSGNVPNSVWRQLQNKESDDESEHSENVWAAM
eukprot:TRINITY_DN66213_c4_g8_i1.p1 TRINITY_DN66213_c4_g8~~TRINITY_DN66213_c4_g8_i1.p1  ORF type:complete len:355 (-),score=33.83 TRINITY_DN66213_c4_g8_i1:343-1407(-)